MRTNRKKKEAADAIERRRVLVLHGPNLNLLGRREHGGSTSLADIHAAMESRARAQSVLLESFQSNHEGELIDRVQAAGAEDVDFIIVNPAAYAHTSLALRDALVGVEIPYIEVHLSNFHAAEALRRHSHFSAGAVGVICGLGAHGYLAALEFALAQIGTE